MRFILLTVAISILGVTSSWGQGETIVVELQKREGFGPFFPSLAGEGPAGDPIGGPWDPVHDPLSGVPDTLDEIDIRFLNFHHNPSVSLDWPNSVDQQVHYLVGRDRNGNFVWIVDTDNDEDLADERARKLDWEGPPMTLETFTDSIMNGPDAVGLIESMPSAMITGEVLDGSRVVEVTREVFLLPFLVINHPSPDGPKPKSLYLVAFAGYFQGDVPLDGRLFTIWLQNRDPSATVNPLRTDIRIKETTGSDHPGFTLEELDADPLPNVLGDVIQLSGLFYRLDDVDALGRSITLRKVHDPARHPEIGSEAPASLADDLGGAHVLVSFWSSRNIGYHDLLDASYPNYRQECLQFVTVLDDDSHSAKSLDWFGIPWTVIDDRDRGSSIQSDFDIVAHPTFVLIEPDGTIGDWQAVSSVDVATSRRSLRILERLKKKLGPECLAAPTREDVLRVIHSYRHWTIDSEWYVKGCSFTADSVRVETIGSQPEERGWPVRLAMEGSCKPTGESEYTQPWSERLKLNTYLYRNLGDWALIAAEPFVELEP